MVHFECYDFPIDIQSLTVLLEFQLADEGITPVEYLGRRHSRDLAIDQNLWIDVDELGMMQI